MTTAFQAIVAASDVEQSVVEHLRTWLPDYLAEVDRQHGDPVGTLPPPMGWVVSSDTEKMPEDQSPVVLVVSPGTTDPPVAYGDGSYTARWQVDVSVHLSARGNMIALRLARLYAAALRAILVQQQTVPELGVRRVDWLGERYDVLDSVDDRTVCTATVMTAVEVAGVVYRHSGPHAPLMPPEPDPGPDSPTWPLAESADVRIVKTP